MTPEISIEKNWVIFDTCAISNISFLGDGTGIINSILQRIGNFTPVITPVIRFEYLRAANSKKEFEALSKYLLDTYTEVNLSSTQDQYDIYRLSSEVACVCRYANYQHYKHIELSDFIHAGLLRRYPRNLYLLTFDIKDFPEPIFNCIDHQSIKIGKSLQIWALLKFNKEGFKQLYQIFKDKKFSKK